MVQCVCYKTENMSLLLDYCFHMFCSLITACFFPNCLVAKQIDAGVMQLIIEHTAVTLETMSHDSHVTYWGCKVFAHAGSNSKWIIIISCIPVYLEHPHVNVPHSCLPGGNMYMYMYGSSIPSSCSN